MPRRNAWNGQLRLSVLLAIVGWTFTVTAASARAIEPAAVGASQRSYSNIYPDDYLGPESCRSCHEEAYRLWRSHPHRQMNRDARAETVRGDFSGVRIRYGAGEVEFASAGAQLVMRLQGDQGISRSYRVTRVVGSRSYEFYVGVQTAGPEPPEHPSYSREAKLPFAYIFRLDAWLPEIYFDSFAPPEHSYTRDVPFGEWIYEQPATHFWDTSCIGCHNTFPYVARFSSDGGWPKGYPDADVWLDPIDGTVGEAWRERPRRLSPKDLVTLGISCESCHFGGREHVLNGLPIRFVPLGQDLLFDPSAGPLPARAERETPYVVNAICSQCHSAPGVARYPNGAGRWNSAEATDLASGACAGAIRCTDCHDPHKAGPVDPSRVTGACTNCHERFRSHARAREHSQHLSVACVDCHMPRITQGLDRTVRTHTISSPSHSGMLAGGAPNACNLCHLDRTVAWTLSQLQQRWSVPPSSRRNWTQSALEALKQPAGLVWLQSDDPVTQLVAGDAHARSPFAGKTWHRLLDSLRSEQAVNRLFALLRIQEILDSTVDYDLLAPRAHRERQIAELERKIAQDAPKVAN